MHDKHLFTEEPCNGKLLSTVLESNDSREGVVDFTQIAREGEIGKRYADKLVKVWCHQGEELWLLVHIEIQAKSEKNFAERMFTYSLRIFDHFH